MAGKRIIIIVIALLLCSCVTVIAFADSISQYSDTGGYDDGGSGGDIGVKALPGQNEFFLAPGIYPSKYFSHLICPHCGATGPDPAYIVHIPKGVSAYDYTYVCKRCTCKWVAGVYGAFLQDHHFHLDDNGNLCAYDYAIDYGFDEQGRRHVQFYCSKHKSYSNWSYFDPLFEVNTFWGVQIVGEDWEEPVSTPTLWETPFVPPYDSFATLEPVSVDNVGDIVDDTVTIVKVVYRGFPYFSVLLTIAIACAFIVVVVRG